jgi:hypothetical protein
MSLEARYRTQLVVPRTQLAALHGNFLETPCGDLLHRALDKVARERSGALIDAWQDGAGRSRRALLALRTPDCPLGLGVDVEADGHVVFRYDARATNVAVVRRLCDEITQTYAVLAVMRAQAQHGFQVSVAEQPPTGGARRVVVHGAMA